MEQRQVAAHGRHHPDAAAAVPESRVDVHPAHEQFPYGLLVGHGELFVAPSGRDDLAVPGREGMGGGGQHPGAVLRGRVDDEAAGLDEGRMDVRHRRADPGGGLDLRPEELGHDLVFPAVAVARLEDAWIGIGQQVARFRVDQKELFLDAECDGEGIRDYAFRHGSSRAGFRELL